MPIGEQIKDLLKERGWSQADLATKINGGADRATLPHIFDGLLANTRIRAALDNAG